MIILEPRTTHYSAPSRHLCAIIESRTTHYSMLVCGSFRLIFPNPCVTCGCKNNMRFHATGIIWAGDATAALSRTGDCCLHGPQTFTSVSVSHSHAGMVNAYTHHMPSLRSSHSPVEESRRPLLPWKLTLWWQLMYIHMQYKQTIAHARTWAMQHTIQGTSAAVPRCASVWESSMGAHKQLKYDHAH